MPRTKQKKWLVRVPITLHLCAEVTAQNKNAAIQVANLKCSEVEGRFTGYRPRLDRPIFAVPVTEDNETDQLVWWDPDDFDACEIFLTDKTEVSSINETDE